MLIEPQWADALLRGVVLSILALCWLVLLIRLNGLRTLSKMTNFDFVATVALGSVLAGAGQASDWSGFLQALAAMVGLFVAQYVAAKARKASAVAEDALGNSPCLLMRDGKIDEEALAANRVTREDLIAKLREANVLDFAKVRAAVLETTGDVSVLHGDTLDWAICEGVRGTPDP